ncbi:MAG: carboxypeptidase-like regulatory domain-containing protein [Bacteroidia bacterium]
MKKKFSISVAFILVILINNACKKDTTTLIPPATTTGSNPTSKSIKGSAQKGPFIVGTSITVYELDNNYAQTGKSFNTQITNNSGSFQLHNLPLVGNYIQIRADGFYFNEVCGSNSAAQITLNGIASVADTTPLNINLLTDLEAPRVEYLLSKGIAFDSAKSQAQREVLSIFNVSVSGIRHSEHLDISQTGDGNASLLAVSVILQGFRTESELSNILAVISNDIQTDGILNDSTTKSSLIDHTLLLDTISIRSNLSGYYTGLNVSASIPHFEKYIRQFITNTTFHPTNSVLKYPVNGSYGSNLLYKSQTTYAQSNGQTSFAGQLTKCSYLKIRMHFISGSHGPWSYSSTIGSVSVTSYDYTNQEQFFTVTNPSQPFDLQFWTNSGDVYLIEYFEISSSNTPTFSKTVTIN